jgi:hypothetical protein
MILDDILQRAWAIVAEHMTRGLTDPTQMVAEGIRREQARLSSGSTGGAAHGMAHDMANGAANSAFPLPETSDLQETVRFG